MNNLSLSLLAFIAVVAMAFGALNTFMTTPLYVATVRLQIDRNVAKIVESGNVLPVEGSDAEFFRTQQELLRSRAMAERVAMSLDLGSDPEFFKPRGFSLLGVAKGLVRDLLSGGPPAPKSRHSRASWKNSCRRPASPETRPAGQAAGARSAPPYGNR